RSVRAVGLKLLVAPPARARVVGPVLRIRRGSRRGSVELIAPDQRLLRNGGISTGAAARRSRRRSSVSRQQNKNGEHAEPIQRSLHENHPGPNPGRPIIANKKD